MSRADMRVRVLDAVPAQELASATTATMQRRRM